MFSPEILQSIPQKLHGISQGLSLMIPEILLCIWILVGIFAELFLHGRSSKFSSSWRYFITQIGLLLAFVLAIQRMTTGMTGFASFSIFWINAGSNSINALLLFLAIILILVNQAQQKSFQFEEKMGFLSVLGGAMLVSISSHWLSIFLSIEWMSLGTYLLVGIRKDTEGARAILPYVLFGLASTALLLYGISFVYGITGSMHITSPEFSRGLSNADPYLVGLALTLVSSSLLFKLAWAPFHPWSPDVIESLPASWMTWISTAPKIAITFLGIRLLHFIPLSLEVPIAFLAILTLLVGNLGALGQQNSKRLLAYSGIAHGGFMAMAWLFPSQQATEALLFYALIYGLSTLLVFYLIDEAPVSSYKSNDLEKWSGLAKTRPLASLFLLVGMVALAGLPPAGSFIAKVTYFSFLWEKYQNNSQILTLILLLTAILTTALGIFYYLKIPYHLYFKKKTQELGLSVWNENGNMWVYAVLVGLILGSFLAPSMLWEFLK
ncbi:NADH-quinone oxidoreductase subunit N [Aquirufa sp. Wall-65K1]